VGTELLDEQHYLADLLNLKAIFTRLFIMLLIENLDFLESHILSRHIL